MSKQMPPRITDFFIIYYFDSLSVSGCFLVVSYVAHTKYAKIAIAKIGKNTKIALILNMMNAKNKQTHMAKSVVNLIIQLL
jgi:hypothetical protein